MIIILTWLTVSIPFVNTAQQQITKEKIADTHTTHRDKEDSSNNPFASTTEEKTPNSVNTISEEFLHDTHLPEYHFTIPLSHTKCGDVATYIAFHGELLSPPPER